MFKYREVNFDEFISHQSFTQKVLFNFFSTFPTFFEHLPTFQLFQYAHFTIFRKVSLFNFQHFNFQHFNFQHFNFQNFNFQHFNFQHFNSFQQNQEAEVEAKEISLKKKLKKKMSKERFVRTIILYCLSLIHI